MTQSLARKPSQSCPDGTLKIELVTRITRITDMDGFEGCNGLGQSLSCREARQK